MTQKELKSIVFLQKFFRKYRLKRVLNKLRDNHREKNMSDCKKKIEVFAKNLQNQPLNRIPIKVSKYMANRRISTETPDRQDLLYAISDEVTHSNSGNNKGGKGLTYSYSLLVADQSPIALAGADAGTPQNNFTLNANLNPCSIYADKPQVQIPCLPPAVQIQHGNRIARRAPHARSLPSSFPSSSSPP